MSVPVFGPSAPIVWALLPGEHPDVRVDIDAIFPRSDPLEPNPWLKEPNAHFGGLSPEEALQHGQEAAVRNLLRQIKYIGMT